VKILSTLELLGRQLILEHLGQDASAQIRPTPDAKFGDYQVNGLLGLAKSLKVAPRELAERIAPHFVEHAAIAKADIAGPGFINLMLDRTWVANVLAEMFEDESRDGVPKVAQSQRIVVDFSSPNVAKQMHVGHLRSTVIGDGVARLLRFVGHDVHGDNHLGDWGTQFGLLLAGIERASIDVETQTLAQVEQVYKDSVALAKTDDAFAAKARTSLQRLQSHDPATLQLWHRLVEQTQHTINKIYGVLDVQFDSCLGESFYAPMLDDTVKDLQSRGLAVLDEGAVCVFFDRIPGAEHITTPMIVRKKDGTYLYATTDIATIKYRIESLRAERSLYVVDKRQSLHFKQLFAVASQLGFNIELTHIAFGSINGPDGKPFKTRDGTVVLLHELLEEAEQRAAAVIQAEGFNIDAHHRQDVARAVGIGAIKYADLKQNRLSDYQFDWDKLITFRGNSGPYLQYAYARVQSIFRKGNIDVGTIDPRKLVLKHPHEVALARQLLRFADVVHEAADTYYPHLLAEHLYELAKHWSGFYEACPVLSESGVTRESRLCLAALCARQLRRGLHLLGIQTIDRM